MCEFLIFIYNWILFLHRQKYVEPSEKEGFAEIVRVNFVPEFKNDEQETLYNTYLLDS